MKRIHRKAFFFCLSFLFIYSISVTLLIFMIVCRGFLGARFLPFFPITTSLKHIERTEQKSIEKVVQRDCVAYENVCMFFFLFLVFANKNHPFQRDCFATECESVIYEKGLLNFSEKLTSNNPECNENGCSFRIPSNSSNRLNYLPSISKVNSTFAAD